MVIHVLDIFAGAEHFIVLQRLPPVFDAAEDRWKALENYEMLRARKYVENVYYHELAKDLRRFGYCLCNQPRGDFEIEGVSAELCQRFSKRHKQIDKALAELLQAKPELDGANLKAIR